MATCKECLHVETCKAIVTIINEATELQIDDDIETTIDADLTCEYFADRSRFVELPCEVGDTVYILGKEIFCDEIDEISIEKFSDGLICFRAYCKELKISLDFKDFGTIAFLTKEEAEQALKERERE